MLRVVIALFAIALATPQAGQKPATPQKPAAAQKPAAVLAALQGTWVFQTVNDEPPPRSCR